MSSAFLVRPSYDLPFFFGGALVATAVLGVGLVAPPALAFMVWGWIALFDGPHMFATYRRVLLDRTEFPARKRLVLLSTQALLVGPLVLGLSKALALPDLFGGFLLVATLVGVIHVTRQHFGFLALYSARAKSRAPYDKGVVYAVTLLPYFDFALTHPSVRAMMGGGASVGDGALGLSIHAWHILFEGLWLAVIVGFFAASGQRPVARAYLLVTAFVSGLTYFVAARYEPLLPGAKTADEQFLLISIVGSVMHHVQYVALVAFQQRARHARHALPLSVRPTIVFGLVFLVAYVTLAFFAGVYPGSLRGGALVSELALAVYWGIALQHYAIDQFIWRISRDKELRQDFGFGLPA